MTKLNRAHAQLLATLASLPPPTIVGAADLTDLEARVDHLRDIYRAVTDYLIAVSSDTTDHLAGLSRRNWDKVELTIWDQMNEDDNSPIASAEVGASTP